MTQKKPNLQEQLTNKSFNEHYAELRLRLMIIALTLIIATGLSLCIAEEIYAFLVEPLARAMASSLNGRHLIFTGLAEGLMVHLKLSMITGVLLSLPVIIWQIYAFLAPGLYSNEKSSVLIYTLSAPMLFLLGAIFVYYLVIPAAWSFFLSFEHTGHSTKLPIVLEARVSEYLDLIVDMIIAFGLAFQMPVILALCTKMKLLTSMMLARGRRYAIVLIFIAAAVLTPPDVFSQVALALPLLVLYEFSILICKSIEKKHA